MTNFFVYGFISNRNIWQYETMITFNAAISAINKTRNNFISFKQAKEVSLSAEMPNDTFEKSAAVSDVIKPEKTSEISKHYSPKLYRETQKTLDILLKEKVIPEELRSYLTPKTKSSGEKVFTVTQTKLIDAAKKRMDFYMEEAKLLEQEAEDAKDEVLLQMQNLFGGKDALGKHVVIRTKSQKSIFNKLVKEFKDEQFYGVMMDRLAKEAFKIPYKRLKNVDLKLISEEYYKNAIISKEQYESAYKPYTKLTAEEKAELTEKYRTGKTISKAEYEIIVKPYARLSNIEKRHISLEYFKDKIITKDEYDSLNKPYSKLSSDEKKLILMELQSGNMSFSHDEIENCIKMYKISNKEREKARNYVKDLVGTRLVLPTGSEEELRQVEQYISKAIRYNKIKITRICNYHDNHILPYIKYETAKKWKEAMPGMLLVENSKVRKRNGYTTTQLNIIHPVNNKNISKKEANNKVSKKAQNIEKNKQKNKTILGELQIRTKKLNKIGQIEHLIYDILEGKDISKGIPALRDYYDSIGIEKAVNDVFNDDAKEEKYISYENTMYHWIRLNESTKYSSKNGASRHYMKPKLSMFGLKDYEILSFESLEKIDKKAESIKKEFTNKKKGK